MTPNLRNELMMHHLNLNETNQTPYKFYSVQFRVHSAAFLSHTYLTYSLDYSTKQRHKNVFNGVPLAPPPPPL
jgi:hypothetical protein